MSPEEIQIERARLRNDTWKTRFIAFTTLLSALSLWQASSAHQQARIAAKEAAEFEQRIFDFNKLTDELRTELQTINTLVARGSARADLVALGVSYLDRMVDPASSDAQGSDRACKVARALAEIEYRDFDKSDHIYRLHAVYAQEETSFVAQGDGQPESMCLSAVRETNKQIEASDAPLTEVAPASGLADEVVVLASYQKRNCEIAFDAARKLGTVFDDIKLVVALSRSQHYAVVYTPQVGGVSVDTFLNRAQAEGRAAIQRIENGKPDPFDKGNVKFVAEAYDVSTRGWSLAEDCPE